MESSERVSGLTKGFTIVMGRNRSFHGIDRDIQVHRRRQKRGISTCKVASDALASDVKAYDAGQIQVLV